MKAFEFTGLRSHDSRRLDRREKFASFAALVVIVIGSLAVLHTELSWYFQFLVILGLAMLVGIPMGFWMGHRKNS